MHWLKYVRLNRKDLLKNTRGTSLEVAMLASPSDIKLRHSLWMDLTLIGQQNVNGAALESRRFVMDYELRCQFISYHGIL